MKNMKIKHQMCLSNISTETPSMMCIQPTTGSVCPGNSGSLSAVKIDGKFVQGMTIIVYLKSLNHQYCIPFIINLLYLIFCH